MGNPFLSPCDYTYGFPEGNVISVNPGKNFMIFKYKYGIIGCTACRQVKGVNLHNVTTKCPHCGKTLKIEEQRILYETSNEQELQKMVGRINEQIQKK